MTVAHFQRRPQRGQFSIERVFAAVRSAMPPEIDCRTVVSPFRSRGVLRRFINVMHAMLYQLDVNHVTGDVHFLTLLLQRRRTVLTIHDCVSLGRLQGLRRQVLRMIWYVLPIWRSAKVTVVSASAKKELLSYVRCDPTKIHVIASCISSDCRPAPKSFRNPKPVVLQIGTGPNKNVERVAEALRGITCRLDVIGILNENQKDILRNNAVAYRELGVLSDEGVFDAYRNCDLVIFASTYEGFGLPIAEANAIGRPVVTSNILSMPEVGRDAACYVDPFNVVSIREGIQRVVGNDTYRNQLVANGFLNAKRFQPNVIANEYAEVYRELYVR